jgi:ribosomal protein L44E
MDNIMTQGRGDALQLVCRKCGKTGVHGPGWLSIGRKRRIVESYCPDCTRRALDEIAQTRVTGEAGGNRAQRRRARRQR